jgi:hypothetical protein
VPSSTSAFDAAVTSLTLFEDQYEQVEVMSVLLNQEYDDTGTLVDVVDVGWRIRGRPGIFQVHPAYESNWQAIAFFQIGIKHALVEGIYAGLASTADLPTGPVGTTLRPLGTPVAV